MSLVFNSLLTGAGLLALSPENVGVWLLEHLGGYPHSTGNPAVVSGVLLQQGSVWAGGCKQNARLLTLLQPVCILRTLLSAGSIIMRVANDAFLIFCGSVFKTVDILAPMERCKELFIPLFFPHSCGNNFLACRTKKLE